MGRLARYKKIKSCDPYSKENGGKVRLDDVGIWGLGKNGRKQKKYSKTAEKMRAKKNKSLKGADFDAPPVEEDDFDMADLTGSLKKEKPVEVEPTPTIEVGVTSTAVLSKPEDSSSQAGKDETLTTTRLLKIDKQLDKKKESADQMPLGRMEGETKRAYHRRVKAETRRIIKDQKVSRRNPEKKQKKKEFLNNKKKKKKGQAYGSYQADDSADDSDDEALTTGGDTFVTGEQAVAARGRATAVKFGEQALRPPEFRQLPRGASKKTSQKKLSSGNGMSQTQIAAEQEAMELVRRKVQAQYAVIKAKRKLRGDFHL